MPVTVPYGGTTELAHAVQSAIVTADTTTAFRFLCNTTAIQCIYSPRHPFAAHYRLSTLVRRAPLPHEAQSHLAPISTEDPACRDGRIFHAD